MSDFTTLLPIGMSRAQKVAHEHVLEALRALITDIGTMKSLIKRVGLKLEVLDVGMTATDISALQTIVINLNSQVDLFKDWTSDLETEYTGTSS